MGRLLWLLLLMIYLRLAIPTMTVDATTRILLDTDMDVDDFFAILYLLKQDRSEIDLKAITINTNSWTDAGHAVNHVYDILYMMDRDDIPVGVGGEGGILPNGTILPNVGGYLPLIDQGPSTIGDCRYRQSIPIGQGGRLDINTNHGLRRSFLPQGKRKYSPLQQPTVQQVMIDTISAGPTTVFLIGSHTNFAIFLMTHPHLKKNIEHIFVMGGGIKSRNPSGCCPSNPSTCNSLQCGNVGNLFSAVTTNTYAEFNIFCDPFAAYQVIHSGIPITLVPLDATNTIPITREFFNAFEQNQHTYEAQYCFQSLKMVRDTQPDDSFFTGYFMWDSFASGVAVSIIQNGYTTLEENEFAEMDYYNITVITSNEPYGVTDGSNPFFDGRNTPMFNIDKDGVHSGHVQTGLQDPFCLVDNGKQRGRCQDGYTKEVSGLEAVPVLVAHKAKPNQDASSTLNRQFFVSFLDVLNQPQHSGRFNFTTEFTHFKNDLYQSTDRKLGKPVVLDMDMSAGDFLTLIYLLKVPIDKIDLKGILVSGNGWASAATIDVIYDILHMMGRDDILVGLGDISAMGTPSFSCKYVRAIPQGSGGFIDSDTLFGLARSLPRSPRSYTAHNSVLYGAPKNTSHPELRQPTAKEVWQSISGAVQSKGGRKITVLANGPLTNLANIITSDKNAIKMIQDVYVVGGHISETNGDKGNVFSVPLNKYSEFNFFLDPLAAKTVLELTPPITLIPLTVQRSVASFPLILQSLESTDGTPESVFAHNLLSTMHSLQKQHPIYNHMDMFLGEVLGAVTMTNSFDASGKVQHIEVLTGDVTRDGQTIISGNGNPVKVLETIDTTAFYNHFAATLSAKAQSAVIRSFDEQKREWATGDV